MNRFRRRRLQSRLAFLAGLMMLWSQFVLVLHPTDSMASLATAQIAHLDTMAHSGCHDSNPAEQSTVCKVHCSQGDQSDSSGRVPNLPFVAAASFELWKLSAAAAPAVVQETESAPAVSWHRPTPHPASLLLI